MTTILRLRPLFLAGGAHTQLLSARGPVTANQLRDQALRLAGALQARPEQRWALWLENTGEFLVSFMALVLAGKTLCLPGNMQPATASALSRHFDALISRTDFQDLACPAVTPEQLHAAAAELPASDGQSQGDIQLILFTSGSTGEPKAIGKTLDLLERELHVLQQFAGQQLGQQPVLSTVSHQHIYGLLHLVLWPLLRRAPIVEGVFQYPEEMLASAIQWAPVTLLSSPTHLKRLPENPQFSQHHGAITQVISSGGLLEAEAARDFQQLTGYAPLEILGSTETGGVAWRRQDQSLLWQPLPSVVCSVDAESGCLAVHSAHLGQSEAFVMGDRIALQDDGRFELLGRADRLLKVEGKRVSASEMENRLAAHDWVAAAIVILLQGRREEVAAAVVLNQAGRDALAKSGKLAVNQTLRDHLLLAFERPVLPRRWRYPAALPANAQGKVVMADIHSLFAAEDSAP